MDFKRFLAEEKGSPFKEFTPLKPLGASDKIGYKTFKEVPEDMEDDGEQGWIYYAGILLGVKKISDLAMISTEDDNLTPKKEKAMDEVGKAFKATKTFPMEETGYQQVELGKAFDVDVVQIGDHGFNATLIRKADRK